MTTKLNAPTLNFGLAAFAAASVVVFFLAMPIGLLENLVGFTGLPALWSAAQPPLGTTARLAAMIFGGVGVFLLVWRLLRALDAQAPFAELVGAGSDGAADLIDYQWQPRRLRRADAHPDAPARRPLLARHELGEPAVSPIQPNTEDTDPGDVPQATVLPESQDPSQEANEDAAELLPVLQLEMSPAAVPSKAESAPDPDAESPHVESPDAASPEVASPEVASDAATDPPLAADAENSAPVGEHRNTDVLMAKLPLAEVPGESLVSLLERLEAGIDAVEWPLEGVSASRSGSEPDGLSEDRLRSVLDDLQRLAARS